MFKRNIFPTSYPVASVYSFITDGCFWLGFALVNKVFAMLWVVFFFPFFSFLFFWHNLMGPRMMTYVAGNNFEFLAFTSQVLVMESRDLCILGNYSTTELNDNIHS